MKSHADATLTPRFKLNRAQSILGSFTMAAAFCLMAATTAFAQLAPSDDNIANAQAVVGTSGIVYGDNLYATAETNEPSPYGAIPAQASVWYIWTAPTTTTMDFSTRYSTDTSGNELGTMMAVYAVGAKGGLTFSNLTLVASNEFDPSAGTTNGLVTSRVDFPAAVGQEYAIQIDGSTNTPNGSNDQGYLELNWSASLIGGTFSFSSSAYFAGEYEDILYLGYQPNSLEPSLHNTSGTNNVRITVTRTGGYTGRCQATLILTNSFYTNLLSTNITGSNTFITNYDTNMVMQSYTNIYFTNIASYNLVADLIDENGSPSLTYIPVYGLTTVVQTNANGALSKPLTNNNTTALIAAITPAAQLGSGYFNNFSCQNGITNGPPTTNGSTVTATTIKYFCTNASGAEVVPTATNGVDYVAYSNVVSFNDFQMSKDIYLQVNPKLGALVGPDWTGGLSNLYYGVNSYIVMTLTNIQLDPAEDPDIIPPTLATGGATAVLDVLNFSGSPYVEGTNTSQQGSVDINWERATARVSKPAVGGTNYAYIYAVLTGNPSKGSSYTFQYTINSADIVEGFPVSPATAFDDNRFQASPGSDFAQPAWGNQPDADFGSPLADPPDPSGGNLGAQTTFGVGPSFTGTITFGPYNTGAEPREAEIAIPIYNPGGSEFDSDLLIQLYETGTQHSINTNLPAAGYLGNVAFMNLTIDFPGIEPGGAYDVSFNPPGSSTLSYPPNNADPGANPPPLNGGVVQAVAVQPNGQSIIGGYFTSYNTTPIYSIARLLTNGWLDTSFNNVNDGGVNGFVRAIVIDSNNRIIVGGSFSSYDGNLTPAPNIVRLNPDGSRDTTFKTGNGFNGAVYALAIDANSNILVGGDFTYYNTTNCNHIARLLPNGGLDTTFLPDTGNGLPNFGTDQDVHAVTTDANGNIIIGGDFNYVNGTNLNYLARLLPSGALDPSFVPDGGPDGSVYSIAIETNNNNEMIIGGAFENFNLASSPGVALVAYNGALDTAFPVGTGANGDVYSVVLQPDGRVLVGGQYTTFNGTRRLGVTRLLTNGWVDTSFMDTAYNQFAGLINSYYDASVEPVHVAYSMAVQPDGNIMVGGSFTNIGGGAVRDSINSQINVTRLIGRPTPGTLSGGGGLGNFPGNITLTQNPYTVDDTAGKLFVSLARVNGSLGPVQVTLGTNTFAPGPGSASSNDFGMIFPSMPLYNDIRQFWNITPIGSYGWRESDGYYGTNTALQPGYSDQGDSALNVNVYDDVAAQQNLLASLSLLNVTELGITNDANGNPAGAHPLVLGGVVIPTFPALGLPASQLEIINNNFPVGYIGFSSTNYTAINTSNTVTITVQRTNGSTGPVNVTYYTANGTAIAGNNYTAIPLAQNKTLTFSGGPNNNVATFTIPILNTSQLQSNKYFKLFLTNASPTGVFYTNNQILSSTSMVTIIDGNFAPGHLSFTSSSYSVSKGGIATIGVQRLGGAQGQLTVQVATTNGSAQNGVNYTAATNTLTWGNQDVAVKTMSVQTLQDNSVDGTLTLGLNMFNATNIGSTNNDSLILNPPTNATLNIVDSDSYGSLKFSAPISFGVPNFSVLQNAGQALITVARTDGTTGSLTVQYQTLNDTNPVPGYSTALAGTNYGATNGTLVFGPGVTSQSFIVPIYYTPAETNSAHRMVTLELFNGSSNVTAQLPLFATLTILDPQLILSPAGAVDTTTANGVGFNGFVDDLTVQPDGNVLAGGNFTFFNHYPFENVARLFDNGSFDSSFLFDQAGANGEIFQVVCQTTNVTQTNNGPIVVAGAFTSVDNVTLNGIARLNVDGSVDETFNPGSGADSTIYAVAETLLPTGAANQTNLAYYIGGNFANFNGVPCGGIARLNGSTNSPGYQGAVDATFNVGQGVTSASGAVHALAIQPDNSVIVGGNFTAFNSVTHNHILRLNSAGVVDPAFNPTVGTNGTDSVQAIAIQPDGRILVGGSFTNVVVSNVNYSLNYLARFNIDGSVDTNFNVGLGGDGAVLALAVDSQERILVGGSFDKFSGVTRNGITRLNPDGTVDPTINFGSGADGGFIDTIAILGNDEIDLGGGFSTFEGLSENNFVRLYGGANSGNGSIQFSQAIYGVLQNGTNATISLQRLGGEGVSTNQQVSIIFSTSDGSAKHGTDYSSVTTNVVFPMGETFVQILVPVINNNIIGTNKSLTLNLSNPTNTVIGLQASSELIITNNATDIEFSAPTYRDSANVPSGYASISVIRTGDVNTTVSATVYTGTSGSATPYTNYIPEMTTLTFNPGISNLSFNVPLLNATNMFSDQTVDLELTNPTNAVLGSPGSATLTIASVYTAPGVFTFSQPSFAVSEGATNAVITVLRTNGSSGNVSVTLTTSNGTAVAGVNYTAVTTNLVFGDSITNVTAIIPVAQLSNAGPDLTLYLYLSNPQPSSGPNAPVIGGTNPEILAIQNDLEYFSFNQPTNTVTEGNSVSVFVTRAGLITNTATVNYTTFSPPGASETNGYAVPGADYVASSGTLVFGSNVVQESIPINAIQGNTIYGPLTLQVILSNPAVSNSSAKVQIVNPGTNTVTIISDLTGYQLAASGYTVGENGSNVLVTVNRLNTTSPLGTVAFSTTNGTSANPASNAISGVDYVATNGFLVFSNGQSSATFSVSILNSNVVESNKTFSVFLSNPQVTGSTAYLVSPSNSTITITNNLTGITMGASTYSVSECVSSAAIIPVSIIGATNRAVSVYFYTTNGTAQFGANYFSTNGTLNFAPGQTGTNIVVQLINNHQSGPNLTFSMVLTNATNAQLVNPSNTLVTIQQCNGITNFQVSAFASSAFISWQTPIAAMAQVLYGATTNYGSVSTLVGPTTNPVILLTGLQRDTTYYFNAQSWETGTLYASNGSFATVDTIILQTPNASYTGDWSTGSGAITGFYGSYFNVAASTPFNPTASATYTPYVPTPGGYNVSVWYPQYTNFTTNAQLFVDGFTNGVIDSINQTANGAAWVPLATNLFFAQGTSGNVIIYNDTGESNRLVAANAMKWSYVTNQDYTAGMIPSWWSTWWSNYLGTNFGGTNYADYVLGLPANTKESTNNFWAGISNHTITAFFTPYMGGRTYRLQASTNIVTGWVTLTNLPSVVSAGFTNGEGSFTNGAAYGTFTATFTNAPQTFFRLSTSLNTNY